MNTTTTVSNLQVRANMLLAELQKNQENPKQAKRIRKELDSIILQIHSRNHLGL